MPEEGIRFLPKEQLLSYEELTRISNLFIGMGVDKIRITGGEPFVRKDLLDLLENLTKNKGLSKLSITTNGILTKPYLPMLKDMGIDQINLSLDTINEANFKKITRRDDFAKVMDTFLEMIDQGFKVKVNAVVMDGINSHEIVDLSRLAIDYPVAVRFIEEMPFNGSSENHETIKWDHAKILDTLKSAYSNLYPLEAPANSTSANYSFDGAKGEIGIIAAFTRTFCGTCDRIRLTSTGEMRTCLYGHNVLDLKKILREGHSDNSIKQRIIDVVQRRARDGFEAEKLRGEHNPIGESMSLIGG